MTVLYPKPGYIIENPYTGAPIPYTGFEFPVLTRYLARLVAAGDLVKVDPQTIPVVPDPNVVTAAALGFTTITMRTLRGPSHGSTATAMGRSSFQDGGGGRFFWDAGATDADDGGTVFGTSSFGRWRRIFDAQTVSADWFGPGQGTSIQSAINLLTKYQASYDPTTPRNPGTVVLGPYVYQYTVSPQNLGSVSIRGQGPAATTLKMTSGNSNMQLYSDVFNGKDAQISNDYNGLTNVGTNAGGVITQGQQTFKVNSSAGYAVGDTVICFWGGDSTDANEPGGVTFDTVQSVDSSTQITLRNGAPENYVTAYGRANIWQHHSHIFKPASIVDGVTISDLTYDATLGAAGVGAQQVGAIYYTRNVKLENIVVKNNNAGFYVQGSSNFQANRVVFENASTGGDTLVSGRAFSFAQCRNARLQNTAVHNAQQTAIFFESQNRGITLDGYEFHSTNASALSSSPFFFVSGNSTGLVAKGGSIQSTVARQFMAKNNGGGEFRSEDLRVDGQSCSYLDLTNHTGQLSINAVVYGARRTFVRQYDLSRSGLGGGGVNSYTDLPKGVYARVRCQTNWGSGATFLGLQPVNGTSPGISIGSAYVAPNTLVTMAVGAGTQEGLYGDDAKYFYHQINALHPANAYWRFEITYFPVLADDNTGGLIEVKDFDEVNGPWFAAAIPTIGTWAVGQRVVRRPSAVGQPKAWNCTTAGGAGTFVMTSEGNL